MKHFTDEEIKAIRKNINDGITYCGICNGRGVGRIYKGTDYIAWNHYGSSAIEDRDESLRWLLEVIFEKCETVSPAIWSNYNINWIPDSSFYKGVDLSRMHPNTFGL